MQNTIEGLRRISTRRAALAGKRDTLDSQWRQAIRELRGSGVRAEEVAEAAGITPGRVWQIEKDRR